jgi:hypothetical protein
MTFWLGCLICGDGLFRLREHAFDCHPEESQATKDLRSFLKQQLP